jgi:hypothetical protein
VYLWYPGRLCTGGTSVPRDVRLVFTPGVISLAGSLLLCTALPGVRFKGCTVKAQPVAHFRGDFFCVVTKRATGYHWSGVSVIEF